MFFLFALTAYASQFEVIFNEATAVNSYHLISADGTATKVADITKLHKATTAPTLQELTLEDACGGANFYMEMFGAALLNQIYASYQPTLATPVSPRYIGACAAEIPIVTDIEAAASPASKCAAASGALAILLSAITKPPASAACIPYAKEAPTECPTECVSGSNEAVDPVSSAPKYVPKVGLIYSPDIATIKTHVNTYGPIIASFKFPDSFSTENVKGGVYCIESSGSNTETNYAVIVTAVDDNVAIASGDTFCGLLSGSTATAKTISVLSTLSDLTTLLTEAVTFQVDDGSSNALVDRTFSIQPITGNAYFYTLLSDFPETTTEPVYTVAADKNSFKYVTVDTTAEAEFNIIATGKETEASYSTLDAVANTFLNNVFENDVEDEVVNIAMYLDSAYVALNTLEAFGDSVVISRSGSAAVSATLYDSAGVVKTAPKATEFFDEVALAVGLTQGGLIPTTCIAEDKDFVDASDGNCKVTATDKIADKRVGGKSSVVTSTAKTTVDIKKMVSKYGSAIASFKVEDISTQLTEAGRTAETLIKATADAAADPTSFLILGWGEMPNAADAEKTDKYWIAKHYIKADAPSPSNEDYAGSIIRLEIVDATTDISESPLVGVVAMKKTTPKPDPVTPGGDASFFNGPTSIFALFALIFAFLF